MEVKLRCLINKYWLSVCYVLDNRDLEDIKKRFLGVVLMVGMGRFGSGGGVDEEKGWRIG